MKNIFKISVVLFIGISLVVSSCKKEEVLIDGCTEVTAMNYQDLATNNDGSCWFSNEAMVNTWNISSVCDGDLVGGVLPSTIEVSAGDNLGDLMIDLGTAGTFNGSISEAGIILIPSQSALSVGAISGNGVLESETSATVNITINAVVVTETCVLTLTL
tara:strand:- start:142 stop:618 length:477 start_codon:yes stop_codon:yes gene_type:complete